MPTPLPGTAEIPMSTAPVPPPPSSSFTDTQNEESIQPKAAVTQMLEAKLPGVIKQKPLAAVRESPALRDLGKGGAQHRAIQARIKEAAEAVGFRSVIEHPIPGSKESIDLFLERGNEKIACEISLTTTVNHEFENVQKCLKSGFPKVAVLCVSEKRLKDICAAVSGCLSPELANRVAYYQPERFVEHLRTLAPVTEHTPALPETRRGIKVKRKFAKLSVEDQRKREAEVIRSMAETMKKKI